jgi:hypothetical protein
MPLAEAYRPLVEARAGGACEYCRLVQAASGVVFHLEHALPQSRGGKTHLANLVLSCPGCNLAKAQRVTGVDQAGKTQPLFNPREYEPWLLGWHLHFTLDRATGLIIPRTPRGEATTATLRINSALRTYARQLQVRAGLIG